MSEMCPQCAAPVNPWDDHCLACYAHLEAPNVRAASSSEERRRLHERAAAAEALADQAGTRPILDELGRHVQSSKAVICFPWPRVQTLLESEESLLPTFYQMVAAGARRPENTLIEKLRERSGTYVFYGYHEKVHCAALSLDGSGARGWGECAMTLKSDLIRGRTTVFEENSVFFCDSRLGFREEVPPGHRALWEERHLLAKAKLARRLTPAMKPDDLLHVLISGSETERGEDFIEVHIFGPIHRRTVERVVMNVPSRSAERLLFRELRRKLKLEGVQIDFEERP